MDAWGYASYGKVSNCSSHYMLIPCQCNPFNKSLS